MRTVTAQLLRTGAEPPSNVMESFSHALGPLGVLMVRLETLAIIAMNARMRSFTEIILMFDRYEREVISYFISSWAVHAFV